VKNLDSFKTEILRCAQNDKKDSFDCSWVSAVSKRSGLAPPMSLLGGHYPPLPFYLVPKLLPGNRLSEILVAQAFQPMVYSAIWPVKLKTLSLSETENPK
jgi:hypothetical protein